MKAGDIVKIVNCGPMPEVVGEQAEIVDLQTQEDERYRVYPVWVKMLTGMREGKVFGFHYAEVEVVERRAKTKVAKELEALLARADEIKVLAPMKVGETVKIGRCQWKTSFNLL